MAATIRTNTLPSRLLIKTNNNNNTIDNNNNNNNNNAADPRSISPPPAYNRIIGPNLDLSRAIQLTTRVEASEDEDSDLESLSSGISLRINTSVTVSGDNNTVCLAETLDASAKAHASAVVKAIQDASPGHCGIPMIDEEGRPRPLTIHVDAGLTIAGAGNIIGDDEAVVANLSRRRRQDDSDDDEEVQASSPSNKRPCFGQ
ncbi:hypothetical protein CP532_3547 [Ophiocordyceps camponoti-leonardi (nom. inval.)]|nr:hypothetical protein CP532_3547 [Ophiocordyceps camponoti-leonardi (nom. inval.)]